MRLLAIRTIAGPNVYSYRPMLQARIDLEDYAERPSNSFPGFCERLLTLLPGLHKHHCSKGHEGGFVERLNSGTYLGHIVEHIALELSGLAGMEVTHGKTVGHKPPRIYNVLVRFKSEAGMRYLLGQACALAEAAIAGSDFDGWRSELKAAAFGPVRLCDDGDDLTGNGLQARASQLCRSHEDNAHAGFTAVAEADRWVCR